MNDDSSSTDGRIPDKPSVDGIEAAWMDRWDEGATYRFDRRATRENVF